MCTDNVHILIGPMKPCVGVEHTQEDVLTSLQCTNSGFQVKGKNEILSLVKYLACGQEGPFKIPTLASPMKTWVMMTSQCLPGHAILGTEGKS